MKQNPNLILRKIGRQYMIVNAVRENVNMTDVFTMNESAAILWQFIDGNDFTAAQLAQHLCDVYGIDYAQALSDVERLLEVWLDYGLATGQP